MSENMEAWVFGFRWLLLLLGFCCLGGFFVCFKFCVFVGFVCFTLRGLFCNFNYMLLNAVYMARLPACPQVGVQILKPDMGCFNPQLPPFLPSSQRHDLFLFYTFPVCAAPLFLHHHLRPSPALPFQPFSKLLSPALPHATGEQKCALRKAFFSWQT